MAGKMAFCVAKVYTEGHRLSMARFSGPFVGIFTFPSFHLYAPVSRSVKDMRIETTESRPSTGLGGGLRKG